MKSISLLKVFIASPGDVVEERSILEDVIKELNLTIADTYNIRLDLVKWETNTSPSIKGVDAQDIINNQVDDNYDIFTGIMWSRAGTITNRAESGTIEEYQRAYDRVQNGENVEVMFYFNETPIPISDIDVNQIKTIQDFRANIGEEGVYYWRYNTTKDFESLARLHLSMKIKEWNKRYLCNEVAEQVKAHEIEIIEEDIEEDGILDLFSDIMQSSFYLITSLNSIQKSIYEFIDELQERTDEATKFSDMKNFRSMQMAITKTAIVMNKFADKLEPEVETLNSSLNTCMDSFSKVIILVDNYDKSFTADDEFITTTEELYTVLQQSNDGIEQVNVMLSSIPPIQKNLNKSKKRISNNFSNMSKTISTALNTIDEIKGILL